MQEESIQISIGKVYKTTAREKSNIYVIGEQRTFKVSIQPFLPPGPSFSYGRKRCCFAFFLPFRDEGNSPFALLPGGNNSGRGRKRGRGGPKKEGGEGVIEREREGEVWSMHASPPLHDGVHTTPLLLQRRKVVAPFFAGISTPNFR